MITSLHYSLTDRVHRRLDLVLYCPSLKVKTKKYIRKGLTKSKKYDIIYTEGEGKTTTRTN